MKIEASIRRKIQCYTSTKPVIQICGSGKEPIMARKTKKRKKSKKRRDRLLHPAVVEKQTPIRAVIENPPNAATSDGIEFTAKAIVSPAALKIIANLIFWIFVTVFMTYSHLTGSLTSFTDALGVIAYLAAKTSF